MRLFRHLLLLLGLVITQTVKAEKTAKAIWTEDNTGNKTMTFVYDEKTYNAGDTYDGETITNVWVGNSFQPAGWYNTTASSSLTKVVFAESFKDARPTSCQNWFAGCTNLSTIEGLSNLNTSLVTTMTAMFYNCQSLESLDVSGFKTSNVKTMTGMFYGCQSLKSLDVSGFNTSLVTTMTGMFYGCPSLKSLDVSGFNTSLVTDMRFMFNGCSGLTTLDLSSFNTGQVTEMTGMFNKCSNLTTIVVSNDWNTGDVTTSTSTDMFNNCTKLVGGKGTTFNSSKTDKEYACIDKEGTPGYLTDIADFFKLEITSAGMATLYYDQALKIPAGVDVYYCSGIDETQNYNVITHEITNAIPAEKAVFLSGNKGHYLFRKTTDDVNALEYNNIMKGKTTDTPVAPRGVLTLGRSNRTGIIGFNYYNGTTIPAYKAYIPADKVPANAPAISFFPIKYFEDEATSISILPEVSKVEDDAIYDLAGRKVKAATKGIFIKNGKKFIVK